MSGNWVKKMRRKFKAPSVSQCTGSPESFELLARVFSGYHCVFVGNPKDFAPYACFATRSQAELLRVDLGFKHPILTVSEWRAMYRGEPQPMEEK